MRATPPPFLRGTLAFLCLLLLAGFARAETKITRDIEYARVGDVSLKLDLYVPEGDRKPWLIVYVHGGAWRGGTKENIPLGALVGRGFPVASVEYRLSTVARFPAQSHDIKAAIRFLRAKGKDLGVDPGRIAIAGSSAGGHLAALVGVSSGVADLEGNEGAYMNESSRVQAIIDLFGASDLQTILSQSSPEAYKMRAPALELLLGGLPTDKPEQARMASPVTHIGAGDPPLLIIHGDADPQMPYAQALELKRAYEAAKLPVQLETIAGGRHGGKEFYDEKRTELMANFLAAAEKTTAPVRPAPPKPTPTVADVSYGPHPHQLLDLYLPPKSDQPAPVLVWYGGLWQPAKHPADPARFNSQGVAVVAVELRTMNDAMADHVSAPVSYVMNDAVRAVQFLRHNAAKWNLDPKRIATGGGSQGALPALYVGCVPDRAKPEAADPVERESSQVTCVAAFRSQPTIDPKRMQEWVPGVAWGAPAFGCSFEESLKRRDEFLPIIKTWSPDALLHRGAAPIYFENEWGLTQPADVTEANYKVHSPAWGVGFQKLAQAADVTCYHRYPGHETDGYKDIWDFIVKSLKAAAK
jgi:acetyl esterase/lipase